MKTNFFDIRISDFQSYALCYDSGKRISEITYYVLGKNNNLPSQEERDDVNILLMTSDKSRALEYRSECLSDVKFKNWELSVQSVETEVRINRHVKTL